MSGTGGQGGRSGGWRGFVFAMALVALACPCTVRAADARARPGLEDRSYAMEEVALLPPYRPHAEVSGTIRIWGHGSPKHDFLGRLVRRWSVEFTRYQPHVRIVDRMYGTASALGALYTGAGDLAILGEELSPAEREAFERERHYLPTRIEIATGSLGTNYFDYAHMVFVNRANPLGRLTVGQLAGIFGDRHRAQAHDIRTWGQLGLTGEWTQRRIHPYFWKVNEDFALFFRHRVLGGSHHWNPAIREFETVVQPDGPIEDRGEQILQALARDPDGIAVSNIRFANEKVKALKLAWTSAGPYVSASSRTLITQSYPLTRIIPAFVDRPPGKRIDPPVREFLRFILSRQGQRALIESSGYLPLGAGEVRAQLRKLARAGACGGRGPVPPCVSQAQHLEREGAVGKSVRVSDEKEAERPLRIWGAPALAPLVRRWVKGSGTEHPGLRVTLHMTGSDTAMAGLYTGKADIALMGRAATDSEVKAYEWVYRQPPTRVTILHGSLETQGRSSALVAFVHRHNPLRRIDFAQLQGLLEPTSPHGLARIRTWGQLGVGGSWASHPVDLYLPDTESGTGRFFRHVVLGGSALLVWSHVREMASAALPKEPAADMTRRILSALARDPYGLAVASLPRSGEPVTPIALGARAGGPYLLPTPESIRDGRYPLSRDVYAYLPPVNRERAPSRQLVDYILSSKGQSAVLPDDGYLPLEPKRPVQGGVMLRLVDKIPVPKMQGRWGELTLDPRTDRLFLSAEDQQKIYVVSLRHPGEIRDIDSLLDQPRGVLYLPGFDRLAVTTRRNGLVRLLHGENYRVAATLTLSEGADQVAFDPHQRVLFAASGGTDAVHGPGWLAMIDPSTGELVGRIDTDLRPGALTLAQQQPLLYVALPAAHAVSVIDTRTRRILRQLPVTGRPVAMALDEAHGRLLVATRASAGKAGDLDVLDAGTGRLVATLPTLGRSADVSFDRAYGLIYVTSRKGFVKIYRQHDPDRYAAGLDEYCLAVPPYRGGPAAVWLFRPLRRAATDRSRG
jgi:phosphate transport system substrate-binding protein